jgi:17beta-estradiol 17-dehydrogenase / very-long-chain 3-oxoacyl-CoA reductase
MARMTHMILPRMIRKSRGVIINIGSISGAFASNNKTIKTVTVIYFY